MTTIPVTLVLEDWHQTGQVQSIYCTELGFQLSMGDLHSGTCVHCYITVPDHLANEIEAARANYGAYPVFSVQPPNLKEPNT